MARNVVIVLTSLVHGGAETQVVELLKQFRGTDLEPRLIVSLSEELLPYGPVITAAGYNVTAIRRSSSFEVSRIFALRRILVSADVHLVHAVGLLASVYCWLAAKWLSGCVVLPSIRGTVVTPGRLRRFLYRRMFLDCPCALANSTAGAAFAVEHLGAIPERMAVVPNGINFRGLRAAVQSGSLRAELNIDKDAPVVGFVGRDAPVKQVARFFQVVERLLQRVEGLQAVVVGPGFEPAARQRLAPTLPDRQVHLLGPRFDIPSLLADMDVLVLTSDSEGTPNVVLESLGVGTPVVCANVGDVSVIVDDSALGAVVTPAAIDSYVEAVLRLIQDRRASRESVERHFPELERRYGSERMARDTGFIWAKMLDPSRKRTNTVATSPP
jgi:glycosyltransferase involved in cell wall biosynthesis